MSHQETPQTPPRRPKTTEDEEDVAKEAASPGFNSLAALFRKKRNDQGRKMMMMTKVASPFRRLLGKPNGAEEVDPPKSPIGDVGGVASTSSNEATAGSFSSRLLARPPSGQSLVVEDVSALSGSFTGGGSRGNNIRRPFGSGSAQSLENDSNETTRTVVLGPVMDFLTADATLCMFTCLLLSIYPTFKNWQSISDGQVPLLVVASWVLLAYSVGQATSRESLRNHSMLVIPTTASIFDLPTEVAIHKRDDRVQDAIFQQQRRNRHSLLLKAINVSQAKIKFQTASKIGEAVWDKGVAAWTNLTPNSNKSYIWEKTLNPLEDSAAARKKNLLLGRLLENTGYRRARKTVASKTVRFSTPNGTVEPTTIVQQPLSEFEGQWELNGADTLDDLDLVIVPQMGLRGMDVFLVDGDPESEVCTHPYLISNGLRDVATMVINVLTPWANLLIYLEMPSWVDKLSGFVEEPEDEEETIALKRFLNADDDYRNQRLKIVPVVAEGPLAVRLLAPPKREIAVSGAALSVTWRKHHEASVDSNGRKLFPALEAEMDCVSSAAIRSMAGILKRNLSCLCIDIACIIQKPGNQVEDEPQACLGLFRFNRIDVAQCPIFPSRFAEPEVSAAKPGTTSPKSVRFDPDVMRASSIMKIDLDELTALAEEDS